MTGRLTAELFDLLGRKVEESAFVRGTVVGLFSIALVDRSHIKVVATEPTTVLRMTLPALLELGAKYADFQLAVLRLGGQSGQTIVIVDRSLRQPAVVGVVHHSEGTRALTRKLARRLDDLGELPCVAGDNPNFSTDANIPFRLLVRDGQIIDESEKEAILKEWAKRGRLLIDIQAGHPLETVITFLDYTEIVLWCVRPQDAEPGDASLAADCAACSLGA